MKDERDMNVCPGITIRSSTLADTQHLIDIIIMMESADCESCLRSWMTTDPNGIKVAITGRGEVVGSISIVQNEDGGDGFCFGGNFNVKPEYQKKNIGHMLWNSFIKHIGTRNAGLNAVPGKLEIYQDGGFPIHETRFTIIEYYTSTWPLDFTFLANTPPPGISISPFHSFHLPSIFAYDFRLMGFKRPSALATNLMEVGSRTLVALRSDGTCAGFGTVKITYGGAVRVGPLYADGPAVAEVLLKKLGEMTMHEKREGFAMVTTSANHHAIRWMERLGVAVDTVSDRLYKKKKLDVDLDQVFGQFDVNFAPF